MAEKIRLFHFWSQKVLPLVYDDSLSYYEVLEKVKFKLNEVIKATNELQNAVDELNKYIGNLDNYVKQLIDQGIEEVRQEAKAQLNAIENELSNYRIEFKAMQAQLDLMEQHLADAKAFAQSIYVNGRIYTDTEISKVYSYINYMIQNIDKEWPPILDPTDGRWEDIQTVINHLYQRNQRGIRVEVFDSLNIPVETLDKMQIPVTDFDWDADYIFSERKYAYMISPFNGLYVPIADVVYQLYNLHYPESNKVEVEEFDNAKIDVSRMDDANVEVITFGTTREWFENIIKN